MDVGVYMNDRKRVLVVGGGIAGITAALDLSRVGLDTVLIDRGPFLGGHASRFACKATDRCLKCNNCLVEQKLEEIQSTDRVDCFLQTRLSRVERSGDGFRATLITSPLYIDPQKCTNCGLCFEKCPEAARGALIQAPSSKNHPFYALDPSQCHYFKDGKARICQDVCPEGAIDLDRDPAETTLDVEGIILATGYVPFDPREKTRFNFDGFANMITGMDLEHMLRENGVVTRPSDGSRARHIAFVQCVGSRDVSLGHTFCSRVCCGYALRMGMRIKHDDPESSVSVFFMDIQNFGKDFTRYIQQASGTLDLIRSMPGDYYAAPRDRIRVHYFDPEQRVTLGREFDLVVLSVGLMPRPENVELSRILGLSTDEFGFLLNSETESAPGIFVAGSAEGPMDIAESITHASRAAEQMARHLGVTL